MSDIHHLAKKKKPGVFLLFMEERKFISRLGADSAPKYFEMESIRRGKLA